MQKLNAKFTRAMLRQILKRILGSELNAWERKAVRTLYHVGTLYHYLIFWIFLLSFRREAALGGKARRIGIHNDGRPA